jgi:hypothetical protein
MLLKRAVYLSVFLFVSVVAHSQINIYLGGNLQGNLSWIRGDEATMEPGFGGGVSFIYWEYEYWFLKAGINYNNKSSSILDYADDYGVTPEGPDDKINITYIEQSVGIPVTIFFRPYEKGPNSILLLGSLEVSYIPSIKESSEEYGDLVLKGKAIEKPIKTSVGIGAGYQRQLDKHQFLNIYPSFNIDLRGDQAYNTLTLTAEFIFGIY